MAVTKKIEMSRAFQSLGYFNPQDIKEGFTSGKFSPGDFGRYEDSGEWRAVEVIVSELGAKKTKQAAPKAASKPSRPPAKASRTTKSSGARKVARPKKG